MQKKKQNKNNTVKEIILYTLIVIIILLITFSEDIIKLANKNKVGLLENTPNETIQVEPNIPVLSAGMIPIKWETDHYVITTAKDNDWYDYKSGKPAYIMLNNGVYQSELVRNMEANGQKLAEENVGNDAINVPDVLDNNPTILMWVPRFAINDETNDIKYIKDIETAEEGWTIPEMFTYKQEKETAPDFLLTGIWFEKDVDTNYTNKINQMNQEESIYGFIANTKAVASDQTTGNTIQNYYNTLIANAVGNDALVVPSITDPTNPNRIILKIINQKNQDPIKAKASYSKDTGLITVQVTYSQYGISKIILENEHELTFSKVNGITTADTTGIELEDGINAITIIDNNGNKKELKVQVMSAIYATLYTDGTLAFGKSENPLPEKTISTKYGDISGKSYTSAPWSNNRAYITTVDFVNKIYPISTSYWFEYCTKLTEINNINNLNTSNVTTMYAMFIKCSNLTSLDLSSFDTRNVTTMNGVFKDCSGLTKIDVSNFDTRNVTTMQNMFYGCSSLTNIDLNSFDASNATNVSGIFTNCSNLTQITFGENWNKEITLPSLTKPCTGWYSDESFTKKVAEAGANYTPTGPITIYANLAPDIYVKQYTDGTLAFCSNNSTIAGKTLSNNYGNIAGKEYITVIKVPWYNNRTSIKTVEFVDEVIPISTARWFNNCTNLTAINNISNLNTNSVTNMNSMFRGCSSLTSLDVSNFDTSNVTNMQNMFRGCSSLTSIDLTNFDTKNVIDMMHMFNSCKSLTQLDVSSFNTSNVTNMDYMFSHCSKLTSLDVSNFDTSNVTNMEAMFSNSNGLTSLDVSNFNTSNVTNMDHMFNDCGSLTDLDLSSFNTSNVTTMERMFCSNKNLTSLDLGSFDTSNVTTMEHMFSYCTNLKTIYVGSNWKLASNRTDMFTRCGTSTTTRK